MPQEQQTTTAPAGEPAGPPRPRRLRSSTVVLGGMGVLAAALTACSSEPDKRCVDRNAAHYDGGYQVLSPSQCRSHGSSGGAGGGSRGSSPAWYYDSDGSGSRAEAGTFSKSVAVDRGGFGCSGGHSGSFGG